MWHPLGGEPGLFWMWKGQARGDKERSILAGTLLSCCSSSAANPWPSWFPYKPAFKINSGNTLLTGFRKGLRVLAS